MLREVSLDEISANKLYDANDMAKVDCGGCIGCSACCRNMAHIILDPMDIHQLTSNLSKYFDDLLYKEIELNVFDGIILPDIRMVKTMDEQEVCPFLDKEGRCSIHDYRPGICRIFPLARMYTKDSFKYFIQDNECPHEPKIKIKVKKWIGVNDKRYDQFLIDWHNFVKDFRNSLSNPNNTERQQENIFMLKVFYLKSYDEDFFAGFYNRLSFVRRKLKL